MKKIIMAFTVLCVSVSVHAQQCMSLGKTCSYPEKEKEKQEEKKEPMIGLLGVSGNFNTEAFAKLNASGKITTYTRFLETDYTNLTFYLALNKNITRTDTLFNPSILFPDLGNVAFDGTLQYSSFLNRHKKKDEPGHYLVPFIEGWIKDFKIGKTDTSFKRFVTLNYTLGLQYVLHQETEGDEEKNTFFSASFYYTRNKIQKKDNEDFQQLAVKNLPGKIMPLNYSYFGVKLALQYNEFQFYFDGRHISGGEQKIPDKEMRGFSYTIGFITNINPFKK